MRVIIAGSRTIKLCDELRLKQFILNALDGKLHYHKIEIVTGMAKGIDTDAYNFAKNRRIKCKEFPVTKKDWFTLGKGAGHKRNTKMADYADMLLLIWDGRSGGSKNMFKQMIKLNKPVYEIIIDRHQRVVAEIMWHPKEVK